MCKYVKREQSLARSSSTSKAELSYTKKLITQGLIMCADILLLLLLVIDIDIHKENNIILIQNPSYG